MITTIFIILLVLAVIALGVMFGFLNKRFDALRTAFDEQLKTLDDQIKPLYERVDKIDERLPIMVQWCETLRENQNILQGDLEKVFYGTKKDIRKIEKQQERVVQSTEEKKPV